MIAATTSQKFLRHTSAANKKLTTYFALHDLYPQSISAESFRSTKDPSSTVTTAHCIATSTSPHYSAPTLLPRPLHHNPAFSTVKTSSHVTSTLKPSENPVTTLIFLPASINSFKNKPSPPMIDPPLTLLTTISPRPCYKLRQNADTQNIPGHQHSSCTNASFKSGG